MGVYVATVYIDLFDNFNFQPEGWFKRVHFIIEWPFSLLRWLTIPPCCHVRLQTYTHVFILIKLETFYTVNLNGYTVHL